MDPLVSVIMPVYKEPLSYFNLAVNSILEQTYQNIELLVIVDNPSNYSVLGRVKELANDGKVRFVTNERSLGIVKSLNRGLEVARGDLIARMDSDDIALPMRIAREVRFLKDHNLDLVATNVIDVDQQGQPTGAGSNYPTTDKYIKAYLKYGDCMPHPTWLGTRLFFDSVHGYRDVDACEDYDLLIRGALAGAKFGLLREPLLKYRINPDGITQTKSVTQKTAATIIQFYYKNGQVPSLMALNGETRIAVVNNVRNALSLWNQINEQRGLMKLEIFWKLVIGDKYTRREQLNKVKRRLIVLGDKGFDQKRNYG